MDNKELNFEGLTPIGLMINESLEKTSAEKAGQTLAVDAYVAGIEAGLGIEEATDNIAKVASQEVGREIMRDFIPGIFLSR